MTASPMISEAESEYLDVSIQALRAGAGADALDQLGWWDLLPQLDDDDLRTAAFALFRAQGRELADSPALGALLAQPYLDHLDAPPGRVLATVTRRSPRRGVVHLVVGDPTGCQLLVDRPGHGAAVVAPEAVTLTPLHLPGRLTWHEVDVDGDRTAVTIDEARAATARERSVALGRVAVALEILGAAEAAVDLAVGHARDREQFGQPIGSFQAVRHLLAWARTDCVAIEACAREAVALAGALPPGYDQVVKALAGRNGRKACERALQVLGGIGFTAEHDHHHHHARVLALDAVLGTSTVLTSGLGAWVRRDPSMPTRPAAVLVPAARRDP